MAGTGTFTFPCNHLDENGWTTHLLTLPATDGATYDYAWQPSTMSFMWYSPGRHYQKAQILPRDRAQYRCGNDGHIYCIGNIAAPVFAVRQASRRHGCNKLTLLL